jgi:hypothetical protein
LSAVDAWGTMQEVRHADPGPAERRRTPQARTAKEIDSSARLAQTSAQLLRKDSIHLTGGANCRKAVTLARSVERSIRGKGRYGHLTLLSQLQAWFAPRQIISLARPSERAAASCARLRSRTGCSRTIWKSALTGLPGARSTDRRFRTATLGRTIAKRSVAALAWTAGRAGPRTAGGFSWICDARTAVMGTMMWRTRTIANYRRT